MTCSDTSYTISDSLAQALRQRRQNLAAAIAPPVILWSGSPLPRNFPDNPYPFRASSHFLYFAGLPLANAALRLEAGRLELFMDEPEPGATLWQGEQPTRSAIAAQIGADADFPYATLAQRARGAATIAVQDVATQLQQIETLQRPLSLAQDPRGIDRDLADAIVSLRLSHDSAALAEICQAVGVSVAAHQAGMVATAKAQAEAQREATVRAAMEQVIVSHNLTCAYGSIVTVQGEVLHNEAHHHILQDGDLLLADVGAESQGGWAADLTRTWPVSGRFSPSQRAIYQWVLDAHDACIAQVRSGVEYQQIHLTACRVLAEGLVDLGILKGNPQDLVDQDAHALFFPHGVGHLLGLDVHDMEDLGDRAGYAPQRQRSDRFGLNHLRLHRPLQAGMVVTIEPGFYQVPALLNDRERRDRYAHQVNWERLAEFRDVRGIRIEDDVLVTETGAEVLSAALPTQIEAIEAIVLSGKP